MKFGFYKSAALVLTIIYMLSLFSFPAMGEEESLSNLISYEDFESEESRDGWVGGSVDAVAAYDGNYGYAVSNPFGDINTSFFGHVMEYTDYIHLEEGKFYTFSAYLMNPFSDDLSNPEGEAYLSSDGEDLYLEISSVGYDWCYVTASFMATESTDCRLFISSIGGDMDLGFFIDNISITEEVQIPKYTSIDGPSTVFIPDSGAKVYRYRIVVYSGDGTKINILTDSSEFTIDPLPEGVDFDSRSGTLVVHSDAPNDIEMVITASARAGITLESSSVRVIATKNLLSDASFENGEELWTSDDEISYADGEVFLYAKEDGEYGKYTSMSYTSQLFLLAGKMYVFRADVRSEEEYPSSSVYISNLSFASSGYAEINITGIGGDWCRVTSAFVIEDTGLYDLTLNLYAPTERPIYIDNVYLGAEDEAPTTLSIHAPGNIASPSSVMVLPCYASVLNQLGETMESLSPKLTITPENSGVYLSDGEIIVEHGAKFGDYTVCAKYEDMTSSHTITVSDNYIGDGGFEEKEANEWWTASEGATFSIVDYNGSLAGHVYSPDSACLVINNSYMELSEGEYYVFSSSVDFGSAVITAFIADMYTGEYVPFAMYESASLTKIPFSLNQTVAGRLVLYIESGSSVGIIFDDISIENGDLSASDIVVSGGEYGEFLKGSYTYINNMTTDPDADVSSTRWYISSAYDGHYEPIGIPNQSYLEFTPDMAGQYILFEVTPICSYTGLVSAPIRSLPILVAEEAVNDTSVTIPLSDPNPVELNVTNEHSFADINSHWAETMIATLAEAGVVSGKTSTMFDPSGKVTRAEFAAMVARAFSLVAVPYSGQFTDVSQDDWYSGWVECCYKRGIILGVSETEFAPNEYITREQMALMVYRAYQLAKGPLPYDLELRYYDSYLISPWCYDAVKICTNLNLMKGSSMNLFKPSDYTTRAEAATVIYRTLKCFN